MKEAIASTKDAHKKMCKRRTEANKARFTDFQRKGDAMGCGAYRGCSC